MAEGGFAMMKIDTERDVIAFIDGIKSNIVKTPELKKFFKEELRRLDAFSHILQNVEMRIAIIGITSSGKSTLMNAVLGANLLPTRVGPSSSKQVLCGWGEKQKGEIVFDEETAKAPRIVSGNADSIRRELEKYGDEKYNPGNRECVEEIRVHAPGFRFNRDLVIIDTPGLDAYGLDQHKEVTMKLVLPTVDMILFLTNVKCDSDAANLGFIDNVTTDEKPLIIVQNKIDSIEPKVTRHGVEKTVEEVKREHLARIRRLVANASKESVRNAPIVQVSAKAPSWEKSNLQELGKVLDEQIRLNSRSRVSRRAGRLVALLEEMVAALQPKIDKSAAAERSFSEQRATVVGWKRGVDALKSRWDEVSEEIDSRLGKIRATYENLIGTIDREYAENGIFSMLSSFGTVNNTRPKSYRKTDQISDAVLRLKRNFESQTGELNAFFSKVITEIQGLVDKCRRDLNLDEKQLIRSAPFRGHMVAIDNCQGTKRVRHTREVPQRGFWGGFKRFISLGTCGYTEETYYTEEIEFNVDGFVQNINKAYEQFSHAFEQQGPAFGKSTQFAIDLMCDELDKRRSAIEEQASQGLPLEAARTMLLTLQRAIAEMRNAVEVSAQVKNATVEVGKRNDLMTEVNCSSLALQLAQVAHFASFECAAALTDRIVAKSGKRHVVVCGWDGTRIRLFREWFFRQNATVTTVDFSQRSFTIPSSDAVVFLLFNAEQTGSFKGKLLGQNPGSAYLKNVARNGKIVWVMDSVREHVSAGAVGDVLTEALAEMLKVVKREFLRGAPVFEVMAGDREIYWSVLLHELVFNQSLYETQHAREQFVADMSDLFKLSMDRRNATGRYVSQYSMSRKEI